MAPRPALHRLAARPLPSQWGDDELVTLAEAAGLFFEKGPFTAGGLRVAIERGELGATVICGRLYTTPRQLRRMTRVDRPSSEDPG